ncbi:hypothetical protein OA430_01565 [Candidatus Pelagibacter sp.]|mgnify:CR=1 FL=1|nr:hypothetical protein [Candidatus Pelagibacter sp.]
MKKNLFNFDTNNSSDVSGSLVGQITCEPCSSECEKIKNKINNRKLSEIDKSDIDRITNVFDINS